MRRSTFSVKVEKCANKLDINKENSNNLLKSNRNSPTNKPFTQQIDRPRIGGTTYDDVCSCLRHLQSGIELSVDFMKCPSAAPFIRSVLFTKCGSRAIPTGIDCFGL